MDKAAGEIEAGEGMEDYEPLSYDEEWEAIRQELLHILHRHKPTDSDNILMFERV